MRSRAEAQDRRGFLSASASLRESDFRRCCPVWHGLLVGRGDCAILTPSCSPCSAADDKHAANRGERQSELRDRRTVVLRWRCAELVVHHVSPMAGWPTLCTRSARVSDPAEASERRSPGNSETFGQPGGSVGDRPQRASGRSFPAGCLYHVWPMAGWQTLRYGYSGRPTGLDWLERSSVVAPGCGVPRCLQVSHRMALGIEGGQACHHGASTFPGATTIVVAP